MQVCSDVVMQCRGGEVWCVDVLHSGLSVGGAVRCLRGKLVMVVCCGQICVLVYADLEPCFACKLAGAR